MKLSCLPVSFFQEIIGGKMSITEWAKIGKSVGLDAVDISILFVAGASEKKLTDIRKEVEDLGMQICMVTSYPDFTHPDPDQRRREVELEKAVVRTAQLLGAKLVRVTAGQAHPGVSPEDGIDWAVEGLGNLVEQTKGMGVQLVYENHSKPGAWVYTDFSEPPAIFLEIARRTESIGLGINFDVGNAAAFSDSPVDLLREVVDRVVSVHASDTKVKGALQHVLVGTGITPYPEIFSFLRKKGWDGWICIEEASFLGEQGVRKAADFIRQCWEMTILRKAGK